MKRLVILFFAVLAMSACTKDNTVPEDPDGHIINPPPPAKELVFTLSVENCSNNFDVCNTNVNIFLGDSIFPFLNLNNVYAEDMEKKITGSQAEKINGQACRVEVTATLAIIGLAVDGNPDPDNFFVIPVLGDTTKLAIKVTE